MATITQAMCPVCGYLAEETDTLLGDSKEINCARCGGYLITGSCESILGNPSRTNGLLNSDIKKASVGYWLRQAQQRGGTILLRSDVVERLAETPSFPSLHDQRENLIRLLGERAEGPGDRIDISNVEDQYTVGTKTPSGVIALVDRLEGEGLITQRAHPAGPDHINFWITLTFDGWLAYEELAKGRTAGRNAFMAMPFNKPDLDEHWLPGLRSAVAETGFTLMRLDDEPKPGLIDVRMRMEIKQARFLIVELTHANLGAYWEAGYAEGLGKPVIYTCREGHDAHFDVDHSLRIEWDPENTQTALDRLKATIRNTLPDAYDEPTNPGVVGGVQTSSPTR